MSVNLFSRWKTHEAVMYSLGSVKKLVLEGTESGKMQFDLNGFLQNVVLQDLNQDRELHKRPSIELS